MVYAASPFTFGGSIVFAPVGGLLTLAAIRRSRHDGAFWVAVGLNGFTNLALLALAADILAGESGFELG